MDRSPTTTRYHVGSDRFVDIRTTPPGARERARLNTRRALVDRMLEDPRELELDQHPGRVDELYELILEHHPELAADARRTDPVPTAGAARPESHRRSPAELQRRRLRRLARQCEARLATHVVGQPRALAAVARAVRRAALGWGERGPLAAVLLVGPTGTGKTELARALASELAPDGREGEACIRIDGAEFGEPHEVAKLLGAPPGYVGHGEPGLLAKGLERNPHAVLLVDEVEKADARLHDLLLQVLDEGLVTDATGRQLDLRGCFVMLTSNAGTRELRAAQRALGFQSAATAAPPSAGRHVRRDLVDAALGERFRPEFLARLQEVVLFDDLDAAARLEIARRQIASLAARIRRGGARVRFRRSVAPWVARRATERGEGARGIRHVLAQEVEAPLAEELLMHPGGGWCAVSIRADRVRISPD